MLIDKNILLRRCMVAILLAILVLGLYWQSLDFSYVWDDGIIFLDKNDLMAQPFSWSLIAQPVLDGTSYFRPLIFLTWFVEFHLFGQNPLISHAINVTLFMGNVLLVYAIGLQIFTQTHRTYPVTRALLAAMMYAIHPALIEVAAWVSGRFDLMCTTFSLIAVWVFIHPRISLTFRALIVALSTLLSLFSKELGIVTPALLICAGMAVNVGSEEDAKIAKRGIQGIKEILVKQKVIFLLVFFIIIFYFTLRLISVTHLYHASVEIKYIKQALLVDMLPLESLREYILIAIFPFSHVGLFYPITEFDLGSAARLPLNILTLLVVILVLWRAIWGNKVWAWLLLSALFSISLVLHIIPLSIAGNLVQNRFMTLPMVFVVLALTSVSVADIEAITKKYISRKGLQLLLLVSISGWLALNTFVTATTISVWRSPLHLWAWVHNQYPDLGIVSYNYMQAASVEGRPDLVEKELKRINQKKNGFDVPEQIIYANLLLSKGDDEAIKYLEGIVYALPDFRKMNDGKQMIRNLGLMPEQVGGVFIDFAFAKMIFEGNLDYANKYNEIADWYYMSSQKFPVKIQLAAIKYLQGDYDAAEKIVEEQNNIYFFGKEMYFGNMRNLIAFYCKKQEVLSAKTEHICQDLRKKIMPEAFQDKAS